MLEKLTEILGEELSAQVEAKLKENSIELGITNDGSLVPADKHDSMKAEHKATVDQLEALQGQIKELEGSTGTVEELKEKLKAQADEFEQFKADTVKREVTLTKTQAIQKALADAGAIKSSIDLLATTFDLEKIQLDKKGNIVDLEDVINPVKEARKELFASVKIDDSTPPDSKSPVDDDDPQAYFNKMIKKKE